jgi:hypothetical protein
VRADLGLRGDARTRNGASRARSCPGSGGPERVEESRAVGLELLRVDRARTRTRGSCVYQGPCGRATRRPGSRRGGDRDRGRQRSLWRRRCAGRHHPIEVSDRADEVTRERSTCSATGMRPPFLPVVARICVAQGFDTGGIHRSVAGRPLGCSRRMRSIAPASISTASRVRVRVEGSRISPA